MTGRLGIFLIVRMFVFSCLFILFLFEGSNVQSHGHPLCRLNLELNVKKGIVPLRP